MLVVCWELHCRLTHFNNTFQRKYGVLVSMVILPRLDRGGREREQQAAGGSSLASVGVVQFTAKLHLLISH